MFQRIPWAEMYQKSLRHRKSQSFPVNILFSQKLNVISFTQNFGWH